MVEMAVNGTAFLRQGRSLQGFTAGLISAVCEWFLIFLLLIDAVLSYLLTQFSIYCELPVPCILCSRLDHVFGREKPGFYLSLFCTNHKSEISSLVSCEIHGKLADGRGMCENCVLSSVRKHKPTSDAHKMVLSRMGLSLGSHEAYGFQSSFYKGKHTPTYQSLRMCLCCNELWTPKPNLLSPLPLKLPPALVAKPNIPLPRHISRRNSLRKMRDKMSSRGNSRRIVKKIVDPLSHVGHTELKINSEPESEFPFTDDDELSSVVPDFSDKEESLVHYFATGTLPIDKMTLSGTNENPEAIHMAHAADKETLLSNPKPHHAVQVPVDIPSSSNAVPVPVDIPSSSNAVPVPVDIPSSSNAVPVPVDGSSISQSSCDPGQADLASHVNTYPTVVFKEIQQLSVPNAEKSNNDGTIAEKKLETDQGATTSDISRAATSIEERDGLELSEEQPNMKSKQTNEDRNSKQGQNSLGQETDSSRNNSSQAFPFLGNEPDEIHKSYPDEAHNTHASVSPDTNDLGFDSFDISSVSDIEGESIVERLRRQVQDHRNSIKRLHKELVEERNAATVSANEALAMISKLQEEKSAWQMEAHQYLRMMEEQAEHDAEQLEKANDLLVEKEKEIEDLEAELDYYRINYGDDPLTVENVFGDDAHIHEVGAQMTPLESNVSEEIVPVQNTSASPKRLEPVKVRSDGLEDEMASVERKSVSFKKDEPDTDKPAAVLSEIEEEKASILIRLKSLEKKFRQVADPSSPYTPAIVRCSGAVEGRHEKREFTDENGEVRSFVMQNGLSNVQGLESKATTSTDGGFNSSPTRGTMGNDRSDHQVSSSGENHDGDDDCIEDLFTIQSEILELNEKFETLETKYNFLDRCNSTQNENEGRKFIREMDVQLRELRRLVSMTRF